MDRAVSLRKEATRSGGMGKGVTSSMSSTLPKPIAPAAPEPKPRELSTPSEHKPQEQSAGSEEKPQELSTAPEQKPQAMPPPGNKSEPVAERALPELSLTGVVKQRTWMSIRVDGHKPKEFIFQPGARPQWRAAKGFEIVVGNAAGVDFELDGKKIQNLGKSGQVVRLSLPEGPDRTNR
jgi:cytoskeleton protein RodZ